ncbi:MAG: hypothetical protein WBX15_05520 [Thermoanaerobaculia bacterium]
MRTVLLSALALLLTVPAALAVETQCQQEMTALAALYEIRSMVVNPYVTSYDLSKRIDQRLDALRGPLPDGSYRWVRWVDASDGPTIKKEHLVSSVQGSGDVDSFQASSDHPFQVRVVVPRKRSLFKANSRVWVGSVKIRYWRDGKMSTIDKKIDAWMAPDTSKRFELGGVADKADVEIDSATETENQRESLVEVHFRQAVPQDDPGNPDYDTIQMLQRLRDTPDPVTLDLEIGRLERRIFPDASPIPVTSILTRLEEADRLMRSQKEDEQEKGKKMLTEVVKSIRSQQ